MSEETVKALTQPSFDKLHSMFDLAWECNKSDETRTNLSRMVTDYITHIMQDYSWLIGIVEDISEDRLRELAAAEREGRVVILDPSQEAIDSGILPRRSDAKTVLSTTFVMDTAALAGKGETK